MRTEREKENDGTARPAVFCWRARAGAAIKDCSKVSTRVQCTEGEVHDVHTERRPRRRASQLKIVLCPQIFFRAAIEIEVKLSFAAISMGAPPTFS